jgi:hypothetical protein
MGPSETSSQKSDTELWLFICRLGKKDYKKLLFWFEIEKQPLYY